MTSTYDREYEEYAYCIWATRYRHPEAVKGADGTFTESLWALWLVDREAFLASLKAKDEAIFETWRRSVKTQRELRAAS